MLNLYSYVAVVLLSLQFAVAGYGQLASMSIGNLPIGVFDSGTGGLTVLEQILRIDAYDNSTSLTGSDGKPDFSDESFVFLADQANMPYGNYPVVGKTQFLERLIVGEAELAVAGARILAQAGKGKVTVFLEDLRTIAFDVVRAGLSLSISCQHTALSKWIERVNPDQILEFCTSIDRAQRAAESFVPLESILLSLFLSARGLGDG